MFEHLFDASLADLVLQVDKHVPTPGPHETIPLPLRAEIESRGKTASFLAAWEAEEDQTKKHAQLTAQSVFAGQAPLAALKSAASVQHLQMMLDKYDEALIKDAAKIRNYVVNKLIEESDNPDPRIRLRAVQLLGNVTEVAAFTERTEVRHTDMSADELDRAIREKLQVISRHIAPGAAEAPSDARLIGE